MDEKLIEDWLDEVDALEDFTGKEGETETVKQQILRIIDLLTFW